MKDNLDIVLKNALKPSISPSSELNQRLLDLCTEQLSGDITRKEEMIKKSHGMAGIMLKFTKAAVILLAVLSVGSVCAYAASKLIREVFVTKHSISVGNPDVVNDDDIAKLLDKEEQIKTELISHEYGDESENWLEKDVELIKGNEYTIYTYKDYETAVSDAGLDNWFSNKYTNAIRVTYTFSDTKDSTTKVINASYNYREGNFNVFKINTKRKEASDTIRSINPTDNTISFFLKNTNNVRVYKNANGQTFTLVDEIREELGQTITTTYVMIAYDDYSGCISFENLTEDDIKDILDTVNIM
jgi:hypothetical protein